MTIPVEKLLQIIEQLPEPYKIGQIHLAAILIPEVNAKIFDIRPIVPGVIHQDEIVFISARFVEPPYLRWTIQIK